MREGWTSVIVLSCNKIAYTEICLSRLARSSARPLEVVIVDNGSRDGSREFLDRYARETSSSGMVVKLILNDENLGAPTGRNQGMAQATGDVMVFMDNDVVPFQRDWIEGLRGVLQADPTMGSVSPKLIYPNPPHWIQCAGCDVSPEGKVNFRGRGESRDHPEFNEKRDVQCLISACMMTRSQVIQEVGPMDEAFNPVEYEDIDYSYRIKALGYRVVFVPTVEMFHFENVTTEGTPRLNNRSLLFKNALLFRRKWRHVFEKEGGPSARSMVWKDIPQVPLSQVKDLV